MRLATLAFSVVLFCAPLAAVATDAGSLGPDVHSGAPAPAPSAPTGAVGRTDLPTQPLTLYRQPRFGIIRLTTAGRESNEVGAPTWRWPDPSLTMPAPDDLLGGHADAWRAVQAALAGSSAHPPAGDPPTPAPTPAVAPPPAVAAPSIDLIGSAGKVTVAAATLAWHRTFFADPAKLRAWIQKLNAPTADGQSQPIQFYVHTIELGEIAPHAGPGGAALYQDCFVAVELRPLLVGGGFDAAPVLILNRPVFAVEQEYWHACGFAEPVIGNFAFTTLRKIKLQLPQRQRNMLGFLRWLNGDWLEIAPDPAIEKIAPLNSLDYATEADFLAALQALRTRFKAKQPQLKLVPLGANLRDRVAKMYQAQDAEKQ